MNDLLQNFLSPEVSQVSISEFIFHLILAAGLAALLGIFYVRYGHSLSNRKALAGTLLLVCTTTMIIITIVKSSLALSLGLVGALSIVRFRTAIKDPEELAFFFIAIAIGLGMGAGQALITTSGSLFLFLVVFLRRFSVNKEVIQNLLITIREPDKNFEYSKLTIEIGKYSSQVELRRLEETEELLEISFFVRFSSFDKLLASKKALQEIDSKIQFNYLEII